MIPMLVVLHSHPFPRYRDDRDTHTFLSRRRIPYEAKECTTRKFNGGPLLKSFQFRQHPHTQAEDFRPRAAYFEALSSCSLMNNYFFGKRESKVTTYLPCYRPDYYLHHIPVYLKLTIATYLDTHLAPLLYLGTYLCTGPSTDHATSNGR